MKSCNRALAVSVALRSPYGYSGRIPIWFDETVGCNKSTCWIHRMVGQAERITHSNTIIVPAFCLNIASIPDRGSVVHCKITYKFIKVFAGSKWPWISMAIKGVFREIEGLLWCVIPVELYSDMAHWGFQHDMIVFGSHLAREIKGSVASGCQNANSNFTAWVGAQCDYCPYRSYCPSALMTFTHVFELPTYALRIKLS